MQEINPFPIVILSIVFILIAVRQVGRLKLAIWQIMLIGALAALLTGSIGPARAAASIDGDVMIFLFGMFVVGEALVESRYLHHLAYGLFKGAKSADSLILYILFIMGFFSAFLMNDTVAVIGTPLVLFFAERHNIDNKLLLLTLCFATTLGSVASPIGNPQNLLIAINGNIPNPFVTFFKYLALPTLVNLFIAYFVLKFFFRGQFHSVPLEDAREDVRDLKLAGLCRLSLSIIFLMVALKAASVFFGNAFDFRLTWIAVAASAPIILLSPRRFEILKKTDWHTLVFFASMFVLMGSVWDSGLLHRLVSAGAGAGSFGTVMLLSVSLSQILSNVPFVALYMPVLTHTGASTPEFMALAAGSTIAGNLLILGAASNIIIIQSAERRAGKTVTFMEFARAGVPLTILNMAVYWCFFRLFR